jgi:dihydroflavonol-4-reductase
MTIKTAFVTGATGLLGNNLCRVLLAQGWQVKGLVRSIDKARKLFPDSTIEFVIGDMENVAAFAPALAGVDVVFHTAAFFREYYQPGNHWETMKRINVDATMELLQAAQIQGVKRAVFTSSSGVIQTQASRSPAAQAELSATEAAGYSAFAEKNLYFKTKVLAEREIYRFLETSSLDVVLILPGWMMGPGDAAPTSAGQLILDLMARKLPGLVDGGSSLADVRDVAKVMITAAEKGKRGDRYLAAGSLATMKDIAQEVEKASGVKAPTMMMPSWFALSIANLSEKWSSFTGSNNPMPPAGIRTLLEKAQLSSAKAEQELGATFRPLGETIKDTVAWYQSHPDF